MIKNLSSPAALVLLFTAGLCAQQRPMLEPGLVRSGEATLEKRKSRDHDAQEYMAEYVRATYSFEFGTRDEMEAVLNDWDLCLQGSGEPRSPYTFDVQTVVDDESLIWDLGAVPLSRIDQKTARKLVRRGDAQCRAFVLPGHSYVVHTVDFDSDLWAAFQVNDIGADSVSISWKLISKPEKVDRRPKAEIAFARELERIARFQDACNERWTAYRAALRAAEIARARAREAAASPLGR